MGDVKLALLLGAMLGKLVVVALMVGMLSALVPAVYLLVRHGARRARWRIPFGPFLAFGAVVALFLGRRDPHRLPERLLSEASATPSPLLGIDGRKTDNKLQMEFDELQPLRRTGAGDGEETPGVEPEYPPGSGLTGNPIAHLVADLLEATGLHRRSTGSRSRAPARGWARSRRRSSKRASRRPPGAPDAPAGRAEATEKGDAVRELAGRHHLPVRRACDGRRPEARRGGDSRRTSWSGPRRSPTRSPATSSGSPSPTRSTFRRSTSCRLATRYTLEIGVAPPEEIELEINRLQAGARRLGACRPRRGGDPTSSDEEEESDDLEADDGVSDAPLVRLVNSIILQAAEDGASDLHFDPQDDWLVVRFRVDGVLQEIQRIPKRLAPGVTTRLKVLAKLDIAERRKPQDGRISLNAKAAGRLLDIRVAVLPTVEGEGVVMRLLDKSKRPPTLSELGLSDEMRDVFEEIVKKPTGALLVTGPTGSGKSTTLYASLSEINRPEINIITVEDPVEYRLAGLNQVQVNPRAGMTFSAALRSILRSDPDVVMVGEIRDVETAKMAIEAALTGHFVLSTLHTNDAPSALTRLNEMGVEPFLTGSAVTAVLAQRLARKLCTHCCEMYMATREEMLEARFSGRAGRVRRRGRPLPQARLPPLQPDRLQGANRHLPAHGHDRGGQPARRAAREPGRARARGARGRHEHPLGRRPRQGRLGPHLARGAGPRARLARSPKELDPK